jgi:indolepyruvate ferredoxin oxidoreductase, alpha subunit
MSARVLLGDEAVALGALHAGVTAAYAYPGTPSTEILEYLQRITRAQAGAPVAAWAANEKTAYEQALGVSMAGRRALVAMKHVGLNVAADPFVNSALLAIAGGLVVVVADDPGMHSSQNEQDSRVLADFARTLCLEPHDPQQAYDMTREAFDLSERFHVPVMIRLVTRLAHSRAAVQVGEPRPQSPLAKAANSADWILLPSNARRRWRDLLARQDAFADYVETSGHTILRLEGSPSTGAPDSRDALGVITAGVGLHYFQEQIDELAATVSHLHIGAYPLPRRALRQLAEHVRRIIVLEDGYPWIERSLRGLLPVPVAIHGRETGHLPIDGELTPETVRAALGLPARPSTLASPIPLPARPPQLCAGCPHLDTFRALLEALVPPGAPGGQRGGGVVTSDIGCYTLAALPPLSAIESCVCMGASVGMAKGASDAGLRPAVAVIGDSTFLHSGVTPLMDAIAADTDMTLVIADNEVVAMTGAQPTLLPSSRLQALLLGLGVDAAHCHVIEAHRKHHAALVDLMRREMAHAGLSVIVTVRECIEATKARKASAQREGVPA